MAQISTAVSELVLLSATFYGAYKTNGNPYQSYYGLIVIGIAASLGFLRFSQSDPSSSLVDANLSFAWLGKVIGMPLLAAGLLKRNGHADGSNSYTDLPLLFTFVPLAFLLLYKILPSALRGLGNEGLSAIAGISMIVSSYMVQNTYGVLTPLAIIAAAVVGTENYILGIPRVDIFHYFLAIGYIFYMYAMGLSL